MILPFKPQFKEKILNGEKIHTIRADKHDRWDVGKFIHFATGVRTKNYECFKTDTVKSVQYVYIYPKQKKIYLNDRRVIALGLLKHDIELSTEKKHDLAVNDGFETLNDFFDFFAQEHNGNFFIGKLIHWTNHKY